MDDDGRETKTGYSIRREVGRAAGDEEGRGTKAGYSIRREEGRVAATVLRTRYEGLGQHVYRLLRQNLTRGVNSIGDYNEEEFESINQHIVTISSAFDVTKA